MDASAVAVLAATAASGTAMMQGLE